MTDPWRYRNKVQQPVGWDPAARRMISGFYAAGSHDIIPIDDCLVEPELSVKIINRARALLEEHGLRAYNPRTHEGWIRHLWARTSQEGRLMLVFVTRGREFPQESKIIPALMHEFPQLAGIHQNVNPARTNVILGREWRRIFGQDYLEERLGALRFRLSPAAFFQVNSPQAEVLYDVVKGMAGSGERLLDLYTGVGTIALWLAGRFGEVGGVEEVPAAIRDAETNAELNGIGNARFMARSVEAFLGGLARDPRHRLTVVVDPPRAGCTPSVLKSLAALRPATLIYVSCDPGTLARDLALLTPAGYRVQEVQPVDLFPHTPHIETAVKLALA
jgi:23S rRNA (uracil1939-C5)-methyltransferase